MNRLTLTLLTILVSVMPTIFFGIAHYVLKLPEQEALSSVTAIFGFWLWPIPVLLSALYLGDRK